MFPWQRFLLVGSLVCVLFTTIVHGMSTPKPNCDIDEENKARTFLNEIYDWVKINRPIKTGAAFDFNTNITDYNRNRMFKASDHYRATLSDEAKKGSNITKSKLCSETTKDELKHVRNYIINGAPTKEMTEIRKKIQVLGADMKTIYSTAEVCIEGHECISIEPGITELLSESRNSTLLEQVWKGWRDATGKKMRNKYIEFVALRDKSLKLDNSQFPNYAEKWLANYNWDSPNDFRADIEKLVDEIQPLYQQLHSFVRRRLESVYSDQSLFRNKLIPAHLLGNMWAQRWVNLKNEMMPFPAKKPIDITSELRKQNYTVDMMFKMAEQFFTSLNLTKMTPEFWNNSMFERPEDGRPVVCHASAWNMGDGQDFRIKMCTVIDHQDFITIHHEMGHVEYYLQYKDQPFFYRSAPNPGFHEALGDTLALSVETPKHLKAVGLMDKDAKEDKETDINYLMDMALKKIVFLPYAYILDRWRWDVFSGVATPENYTKHWWDLRCKYQGVVPPTQRSEEDCDPVSKYHGAANVAYIRYFVSYIVQFQFYEALCNATNHTGPLFKCDFYNNSLAGAKLSEMLRLGDSKPWPDALEMLTGSRELSLKPLMRYFEPLTQYLESVNGQYLDWQDQCGDESSLWGGSSKPTPRPMRTTTHDHGAARSWQPGFFEIVLGIFIQIYLYCFIFSPHE